MAQFIKGSSLIELLEAPESSSPYKITVVDVRDYDYEGGHIRGSVNIPASKIQAEPERVLHELVSNASNNEKPLNGSNEGDVNGDGDGKEHLIVVHCALSQVRGPKCASALQSSQHKLSLSSNSLPKIVVLENGFEGFVTQYGSSHPDLFEDVDSEQWRINQPNPNSNSNPEKDHGIKDTKS
eukprot:CAMPEP_0184692972 /NCGR_PEP_ID=MMETSP0313-20130426/1295_1 /TAXON_ID=2792 /ORGANISM="Porphyridium aerugineum, Strain SAG 1380-2" /LENGTH=181 /DNA_ID=CAMNT_0027150909 /DNA_START=140 /DNA_END=685 /DNA_ORIENTATION=+